MMMSARGRKGDVSHMDEKGIGVNISFGRTIGVEGGDI